MNKECSKKYESFQKSEGKTKGRHNRIGDESCLELSEVCTVKGSFFLKTLSVEDTTLQYSTQQWPRSSW